MSEILISLTIIGVIAAITIPSLISNINEKTFTAKRKALYSRISQAIALMPNLNGFGEYAGTWNNHSVTVSQDTATASFITNGLAKVLELENICTVDKSASADAARAELKKCGIPSQYTKYDGTANNNFPTKLSELNRKFVNMSDYPANVQVLINPKKNIDTRVGAFTTKNGESVSVFYNPQCVDRNIIFKIDNYSNGWYNINLVFPYTCANFIYDLNGLKGPNKVGKDIGILGVLYPNDSDVINLSAIKLISSTGSDDDFNYTYEQAVQFCKNNDAVLLNLEQAKILSMNIHFAGYRDVFWLQGKAQKGNDYALFAKGAGLIVEQPKSRTRNVNCVKR